jgi:hypothetical protein
VQAVKKILRYLKGILDFGLWYPIDKDITLTSYTNAHWECSVDEKKSTSGETFFLCNIIVS